MPQKNELYEVNITTVNHLGYGICRIDGIVCFVSGGVTGDVLEIKIIKVNKNYCVGRIEKIITPSDKRETPDCPIHKLCGGCVFRHLSYKHELELKKSFVEAEFKKAGLATKVNDVVSTGATTRYRNKAQYPIDSENKIGFYTSKSHSVCEIDDCILEPEIFSEIVSVIKDFMKIYKIKGYDESTGKGLLRHIYLRRANKTSEINLCLCINGNTLPHSDELLTMLKIFPEITGVCLNINTKNTNVILGDKYITLSGREYIEDILCGLKFRISPSSFYQVNRDCAELLYQKVAEHALKCGKKRITDLYCGTGTIGLYVASKIKDCTLTGVEIVPSAIENAKVNAKINGIENSKFICADSTDTQSEILSTTDTVILDPPRKGITKELADKINESGIKRIIYVSCSPDTLARDIKYFSSLGYICDEATPYDMFPRTSHIECACLIYKQTAI